MAGESRNQRAGVRRTRQANVAGGRSHRCVVKLSDSEYADLTARAEAAEMTVPRLLVETTLGKATPEVGRAAAALRALEEGEQDRRALNNLNQLVRYSHQNRELAEGLPLAVAAVVRAALQMDALARWVMGETPSVSPSVIGEDQLAAAQEWAERVDNLRVPGIDEDIDDVDGGGV